jgi:hypothetical protein
MLRISFVCAALAASSLTACQTAPKWSTKTRFPVQRPIVEAMCEIAQTFNDIRSNPSFPKSYYVVTITLENWRQNKFGAGVNASYRTRDAGDRYFEIGLGQDGVTGLGGDQTSSRLSMTPVTFELTDLGIEDGRVQEHCDNGHASDTKVASSGADLGLSQWFYDVMYAAPVGVPDNPTTTVRLERTGGGSLFPSWRFVRGFVSPDLTASYADYDQLKVELKNETGKSDQQAGAVRVTRDGKTTKVPAISTETYRSLIQPTIRLAPLQ